MNRIAAAIALLLLPSCSSMIYSSGKYKEILSHGTPRSAVIAAIGTPALTQKIRTPIPPIEEKIPLKKVYQDTHFTREVLPDRMNATGAGMAYGMSFGLSEFCMIPISLGHFSHKLKKLEIYYDERDQLDGYRLAQPTAEEKRLHSQRNEPRKGD